MKIISPIWCIVNRINGNQDKNRYAVRIVYNEAEFTMYLNEKFIIRAHDYPICAHNKYNLLYNR